MRRSYSSSLRDSDDGEKAPESRGLFLEGPSKERRPGVGKEREGVGLSQPGGDCPGGGDTLTASGSQDLTNHKLSHTIEGQSDQGSQSDSVFEDADKPLRQRASDSTTSTSEAAEGVLKAGTPLADLPGSGANAGGPLVNGESSNKCQLTEHSGPCAGSADPNESREPEGIVAETEHRDVPQSREVRPAVLLVPRRKRKGKVVQRRARSGGRGNQKASKALPRAPPPLPARPSAAAKLLIAKSSQSEVEEESSARDKEHSSANPGAGEDPCRKSSTETETESLPDSTSQSGVSSSNHDTTESGPETPHPDQSDAVSTEAPPLLRELDADLLQSGKFKLAGTVDRLGRALVVTETHVPEEGYSAEEMARVLSCYHRITR